MGIVTTIAPFALALIMLGLGASLTVRDFTRVFQHPKEFFVGLICQLIVLPIIGYVLIIILKSFQMLKITWIQLLILPKKMAMLKRFLKEKDF